MVLLSKQQPCIEISVVERKARVKEVRLSVYMVHWRIDKDQITWFTFTVFIFYSEITC